MIIMILVDNHDYNDTYEHHYNHHSGGYFDDNDTHDTSGCQGNNDTCEHHDNHTATLHDNSDILKDHDNQY